MTGKPWAKFIYLNSFLEILEASGNSISSRLSRKLFGLSHV